MKPNNITAIPLHGGESSRRSLAHTWLLSWRRMVNGVGKHWRRTEDTAERAKGSPSVAWSSATTARAIRVLCVTPYGKSGRGGIDRLYYHLRISHDAELPGGIEMTYFVARGAAPGNLWVLTFPWRVVLFLSYMVWLRPHIVHLNFSNNGSIYRKYVLLRIASLFRSKTVLHFHGFFSADEIARAKPAMRLLRDMSRRATRIVVLGGRYRSAFETLLGVPSEKLEVLANGIADFAKNQSLPKPHRPEVKLLFIGELGVRKGTDILIGALTELAARTRSWKCLIAGNGDATSYRAQVRAASCQDLIEFVAWLDPQEVADALLDSDIVILPSRAENLPMSLIEGACAGAALIATPVGEAREIVQGGRNGILVAPSARELAAVIESMISHPEAIARMQIESRKVYLEKFDIATFADRLSGIFGRAMTAQP